MLWMMFCRKSLGPGIYIDASLHLIVVANRVRGSSISACLRVISFSRIMHLTQCKLVQEWLKEHDGVQCLDFPSNFPRTEACQTSVECPKQTSQING